MIVTLMPSDPISFASDSERPFTLDFAAARCARPTEPTRPPIDAPWIRCPPFCSRKRGNTVFVMMIPPKRFVSIFLLKLFEQRIFYRTEIPMSGMINKDVQTCEVFRPPPPQMLSCAWFVKETPITQIFLTNQLSRSTKCPGIRAPATTPCPAPSAATLNTPPNPGKFPINHALSRQPQLLPSAFTVRCCV
jgi:hypothetical protein